MMPFKNNPNIEFDSRLIFEADRGYHSKVEWLRPKLKADSEWIFCGTGDEFNMELVVNAIEVMFISDPLYLSHDRQDSSAVNRADFISTLANWPGKDFRLWDREFKNVIEFSKVGIIRLGKIGAN